MDFDAPMFLQFVMYLFYLLFTRKHLMTIIIYQGVEAKGELIHWIGSAL